MYPYISTPYHLRPSFPWTLSHFEKDRASSKLVPGQTRFWWSPGLLLLGVKFSTLAIRCTVYVYTFWRHCPPREGNLTWVSLTEQNLPWEPWYLPQVDFWSLNWALEGFERWESFSYKCKMQGNRKVSLLWTLCFMNKLNIVLVRKSKSFFQ